MAEKKLTSSNILSLHSKTFSQKKIHLDINGIAYQILIDEKFKPSKIQELIFELVEKQKQIRNFNDVFNISYYCNFLILKYFTDIDVTKTDSLEEELRVFKAILDLEIFEKIMDSFDPQELDKINLYLKKIGDNVKKLESNPEVMEDINQIMQSIMDIKNPELFMGDEETETETEVDSESDSDSISEPN